MRPLRYELIENQFWIVDDELQLNLTSTVGEAEKTASSVCYKQGGELHGPSMYYGASSQLLSLTWYWKGEKTGRSIRYYASGALASIERFVQGKKHLRQEYYAENQTLTAMVSYQRGELDGVTHLFWPSGRLKRESHFLNGTLQEEELFLDEEGNRLGEMANTVS